MGKFIDLTGQRFGKLIAVKPTEGRKGNAVVWECLCDCGNAVFVAANSLRSGNTKSCGCLRTERTREVNCLDLTGQRFGKLTAIRQIEERHNRRVIWECVCDCGNTAFVASSNLQAGRVQSCGCFRVERMREASRLDLTGQRFGKLTAVRPTERKHRNSFVWECKCDCGETTFVCVKSLRDGHTKSCGCLTNSIDLTGQRFGKLIAVRPTEERKNGQVVWESLCDCGNTVFVTAGNLRRGHTQSCGCE